MSLKDTVREIDWDGTLPNKGWRDSIILHILTSHSRVSSRDPVEVVETKNIPPLISGLPNSPHVFKLTQF